VLVAALATVLSPGNAVAVALVVRVVTTASDLAWGGIGLAAGRLAAGRLAGRRRAAHTARHALPGPRKNVRPRL